ncbi:MAG: hypothetical protein FJ304_19625 [Planctomycetes bacterium]|nr:hypothetical protein [Planctomycetota bacterium]
MSERVAPRYGAEHAVPWATPPIPGTVLVTFRGTGDGTSEPFAIPAAASVRVSAVGALVLRVVRADGAVGATINAPAGGQALAELPHAGTYALDVRASGEWGVTVVYFDAK